MTGEQAHAHDGDRLAGLGRPLRNRVTPAGELIATVHRGTMYGNRGVLHNDDLALVRRYQVRRWLVCVLEFRGRRRPLLRPGRYTELFFLDEAVALAAGHRPCAECRYLAYQSFRAAWATALALPAEPAADDIDQVLHRERRLAGGARVTYPAPLRELPDGAFIVRDGDAWLVSGGGLRRWTPAGYTDRVNQFDGPAAVLTPRATVAAIRAGYRPLLHPSASGASLEEETGRNRSCTARVFPSRSQLRRRAGPASRGWARRRYWRYARCRRIGSDASARRVLLRCRRGGAASSIASTWRVSAVSRASPSRRATCWPTHWCRPMPATSRDAVAGCSCVIDLRHSCASSDAGKRETGDANAE